MDDLRTQSFSVECFRNVSVSCAVRYFYRRLPVNFADCRRVTEISKYPSVKSGTAFWKLSLKRRGIPPQLATMPVNRYAKWWLWGSNYGMGLRGGGSWKEIRYPEGVQDCRRTQLLSIPFTYLIRIREKTNMVTFPGALLISFVEFTVDWRVNRNTHRNWLTSNGRLTYGSTT